MRDKIKFMYKIQFSKTHQYNPEKGENKNDYADDTGQREKYLEYDGPNSARFHAQ